MNSPIIENVEHGAYWCSSHPPYFTLLST